jgi:hypothetical protein
MMPRLQHPPASPPPPGWQTYERMTPLAVDHACLPNGWQDVQPGDAIVAFSRQQLYHIRKVRLPPRTFACAAAPYMHCGGRVNTSPSRDIGRLGPAPEHRATGRPGSTVLWTPHCASPPRPGFLARAQHCTPRPLPRLRPSCADPSGGGEGHGPPHLHRVWRAACRDAARASAALQRPGGYTQGAGAQQGLHRPCNRACSRAWGLQAAGGCGDLGCWV